MRTAPPVYLLLKIFVSLQRDAQPLQNNNKGASGIPFFCLQTSFLRYITIFKSGGDYIIADQIFFIAGFLPEMQGVDSAA